MQKEKLLQLIKELEDEALHAQQQELDHAKYESRQADWYQGYLVACKAHIHLVKKILKDG